MLAEDLQSVELFFLAAARGVRYLDLSPGDYMPSSTIWLPTDVIDVWQNPVHRPVTFPDMCASCENHTGVHDMTKRLVQAGCHLMQLISSWAPPGVKSKALLQHQLQPLRQRFRNMWGSLPHHGGGCLHHCEIMVWRMASDKM